jgi:hypothetical protein
MSEDLAHLRNRQRGIYNSPILVGSEPLQVLSPPIVILSHRGSECKVVSPMALPSARLLFLQRIGILRFFFGVIVRRGSILSLLIIAFIIPRGTLTVPLLSIVIFHGHVGVYLLTSSSLFLTFILWDDT